MNFNPLRMVRSCAIYRNEVMAKYKEQQVELTVREVDEIELAFEAGYRAGHSEGWVESTRRESPEPEAS